MFNGQPGRIFHFQLQVPFFPIEGLGFPIGKSGQGEKGSIQDQERNEMGV
jgi:hypothetical protein